MFKKMNSIIAGIMYIRIFCCSFAFTPFMPMYDNPIAVIATRMGST